ncbi:hypothetical protein BX600DRAFT_389368 [Xylariales sp. PMI_506]|nr:hypothetical protein BX600DRAFT_389368 [Xylariales sp. PMI_506]
MSAKPGTILFAAGLISSTAAQVATWGQCGGIGYSGSTSCTSGTTCTSENAYYYQCIPATTTVATSTATSKITTTTTATSKTSYFVTYGDSYSQSGFNITIGPEPSESDPLGNPTFPGWTTSGGWNWIDWLVAGYNTSLLLNFNFAYGGATTDGDLVPQSVGGAYSFVDQTGEFDEYLAPKPAYAPWTSANLLVGVWMGVNDVGNSYFETDYDTIASELMAKYFEMLQDMYDNGVRNFVLLTCPPIQRTPAIMAYGESVEDEVATAIEYYNSLMTSNLKSFNANNSGVSSWIADTWTAFNAALDDPTAYGADNATCYSSDGTSCLWYNDYHPAEAIHKLVAQLVAETVGSPWFQD